MKKLTLTALLASIAIFFTGQCLAEDLGDMRCAETINLGNGAWHQVSLPCETPGQTLENMFGYMELGVLGTDWAVYRYDATGGFYVALTMADTMDHGMGYWIIQTTGEDRDWTITGEPIEHEGYYYLGPVSNGNSVTWNMIGNPLNVPLAVADIKVTTSSGTCAVGCTLEEASAEGLVHDKIFAYNAHDKQYETLGMDGGILDLGAGFWVAIKQPAQAMPITLKIAK